MAGGRTRDADGATVEPPRGWTVDVQGRKVSTFRHRAQGLEVIVRAVFNGSKHRPGRRDPAHYVVRLHEERLSLEPDDGEDRSAKVASREEAFDLARSFMDEASAESA